jgi:hypothetical protein
MFGNGTETESFSSGGLLDLSFYASGGVNGSFAGGEIPITWDFNVATVSEGQAFWVLTLPQFDFLASGATNGGNVTGSGFVTVGSGSYGGGYSLRLDVNQFVGSGGTLGLDVPTELTVVLNPAESSSTPEPGTFGMLGAALGSLAFWRRRKKA